MTRFFAALLALAALLGAIVLLAPQLVPAEAYRARIEATASAAIGREVTLGERVSFRLFPQAAFRADGLVVANAEGFEGDYLAKVGAADVGVRLWPLLFNREVVIDRFVLERPELNLQKSASGAVNWTLGGAEGPTEAGSDTGVRELRLGDVRLVDGRATYVDASTDQTWTFEDIDAAIGLASLAEPLEFEGTLEVQGAPSSVDLVLSTLGALRAGQPADLKIEATIGATRFGGDIRLEGGGSAGWAGKIDFDAPDLPALAALVGAELADAPGFDRLSASGAASGDSRSARVDDASIRFDAIDATGDLALDWGGAKPKVTGALDAGVLDLRPYLPEPTEDAGGFPQWSNDTLDFGGLRNVDADIALSAEQIFLNGLRAGASRMKVKIQGGRLSADIPQLDLYGGGGSGRLTVDASGRVPAIAGAFDFGSVEAQPLTIDMMKIDNILGLGGVRIEFSATGASQAAIMSSIDGKGGFELADGALKGLNIAKLAGAVAKLYEGGLTNPAAVQSAIAEARRPTEQTDFSRFLTQFSIVDGATNVPTITLEGPFVAMTGAGSINLPSQTLDLRLLPRAATSADGATGRMVAVPVRITGTFSAPVVAVDVEALLRGKAESILQDALGKAIGSSTSDVDLSSPEGTARSVLDSVVRGALGGSTPKEPAAQDPEGGATPDPETGASAPRNTGETLAREAIGRFFGRPSAPAENPEDAAETESETDPERE